jgi:hypothetical protein
MLAEQESTSCQWLTCFVGGNIEESCVAKPLDLNGFSVNTVRQIGDQNIALTVLMTFVSEITTNDYGVHIPQPPPKTNEESQP